MAEEALYKALGDYNKSITNNFKSNWGSLLTYIGKAVQSNSFVYLFVDRRRRHRLA
jgi:hypothetical protein